MLKQFTSLIKLMMLLLFPVCLTAQVNTDYNILLHSGKFIPAENISRITKSDDVFKQSLFNGKHYVIIQFKSLPTQLQKDELKAVGIELIDYIPRNAYTAVVSADINISDFRSSLFRAVFQFSPVQKTVPAVLSGNIPAHAIKQAGTVDLTIITYEKLSVFEVGSTLQLLKTAILEDMPMFRSFTIRLPRENMKQLVALPFIQWVEFIDPPNELENTLGRTLHRVNVLNDGVRNLNGDLMNVGIWDEGEISPHLDFSPAGRVTQVETGTVSSHSTHCSGTILGRGLINPTARGMASNAKLYSYNFNGNIQTEMATGIPLYNLVVSSHSYGSTQTCGLNGAGVTYSATSRATDLNLNNFPYHLHCHSAGNSQAACAGGWSTITASGKSAKNNILVANITTSEVLSGSSSCGPVQDGRVKPEISAFGTTVFSTYTPLNTYGTISGTSMSTPGVAGSVTLLVQRYKQLNSNNLPASTLIKNTILNTAHDLGNPGPDYRFGYGRINALEAVKILETNRYVMNTITTGATNNMTISVPSGAARLRVMLTWNDPAGAANANPALVNNLDLSVINGATTTLPWILDPNNPANNATQGVDVVSNIEQVTIENPASGTYTLRVFGMAVPTGPNQEYALTWSVEMPYIEVIYPNGNENFNPSSAETITWNNAGVTANQTVEYSIDGGSNWNTISSTVPATTTRLFWSVPSANTSTALIRVSSGALTDQSDVNFKILGTVIGFSGSGVSCAAGEVIFNWTATTNATHYDILFLNTTTGNFDMLATNVTGTTYTAGGLTPNLSMWFYIRAKNNTTGAQGERSNAINVTVSNGGGGIGSVGPITGQTSICGTPSNVPYSIATVTGATSYNWTPPPGANIAGGQGTISITVNYPGGSSSGNLSVTASNASCTTAPSVLAITIGSSSVPAPISGGDQSITVCSGSTIPTLTATATVPSGHTVKWYSAATGGTVITNPILNTIGTITYYAASVNNTTLCESAVRTPVTLTINSIPGASATAGGPTTFCQGGSVVLTASSGTSYLWNTGATTQSITVTVSGSYTCTVTTPTCTSTTAPIVVTVNPIPTASITAGGPTTFCQPNTVVLTASAGISWLWSTGATTQSITVSASGSYSVTVTGTGGCVSSPSAATIVTVNPKPAAPTVSAGGPVVFCQPGSVVLTSSAGNSWLWSNGATTQSITVSTSGSFTVTITNANGCVSDPSTAIAVTANPKPIASITAGGPIVFCQPNSVVLTASAGSSWIWSTGATTQSITVSASGSYWVRVTNSSGCISDPSTAVTVTANPKPAAPSVSASGPTTICQPNTVILTATAGSSWLWSTGATTQSITVSASGNYSVTITNSSGCVSDASVAVPVAVSPQPSVSISASPYIKLSPGMLTTLTANVTPPGTYTYVWMRNGITVPGANGSTLEVNFDQLGSYTVRVTNTGNCSNTSAAVSISDLSSVNLFILPNPNAGQFDVVYYSASNTTHTLRIFDTKAAVVYSNSYSITGPYQRMPVDMRSGGKGTYIVVLFNNNGKRVASGKVVIQ